MSNVSLWTVDCGLCLKHPCCRIAACPTVRAAPPLHTHTHSHSPRLRRCCPPSVLLLRRLSRRCRRHSGCCGRQRWDCPDPPACSGSAPFLWAPGVCAPAPLTLHAPTTNGGTCIQVVLPEHFLWHSAYNCTRANDLAGQSGSKPADIRMLKGQASKGGLSPLLGPNHVRRTEFTKDLCRSL